jgi:hypothetical protein
LRSLLGYSNPELARVDPLEMNLLVAKGIPQLAHLDIPRYQRTADKWAAEARRAMRSFEGQFHAAPQDWKNDLAFFRLGVLCWYVDEQLGIRYREDQRDLKAVHYTDPNDLFLHGVMDSRRGTCANMAALHVALGWRLGWPVSLACAGAHFLCRYDDGKVTHNIEATKSGLGGFQSHPDSFYLKEYGLPEKAVRCGSDLRALTPTELLGVFIGLRGRFWDNTGRMTEADADYLLARALCPRNRYLYHAQMQASVQESMDLFEPGERDHPIELASWLQEVVRVAPREWRNRAQEHKETSHASAGDAVFTYDYSGKQQ